MIINSSQIYFYSYHLHMNVLPGGLQSVRKVTYVFQSLARIFFEQGIYGIPGHGREKNQGHSPAREKVQGIAHLKAE